MFRVSAFILLLSFLQCHADDVPVQKDFQMSQFQGKWYGIATSSNCPMFQKMKEGMALPIIVYSVGHGNTIKFSAAFHTPKGCQQMDVTYETVAEGHYKHDGEQGDNEVFIVGTDYKAFALEFIKTKHEGMTCITINLYGRDMNLPEEVKMKYMGFVKSNGLTEQDTKMFNKGELCTPHVA